MNRTCVFVGTFDPLTLGHLWLIENATKLFEKLYVATGENPEKTSTFSVKERISMLSSSLKCYKNVEVCLFQETSIVKFAIKMEADFILRGVRNEADYKKECMIRKYHDSINPHISTIFLMSPSELSEISSTAVRDFINKGNISLIKKYVPKKILQEIIKSTEHKQIR